MSAAANKTDAPRPLSPAESPAEAAARQRKAFEAIEPGVLSSPLPSAVASLSGRIALANASYCRLLGRDLGQLRELSVADITHPEDVERDGRALRAIARGELREHQIRKRYVLADGDTVAAWTHVGPVHDTDGRPVGLLAHVLEVVDQPADPGHSLRDERSFRLLFAANPQPMWIFDLETLRFLEVNDAACTHYGYTRRQFRERTIADLRLAEDVPALQSHLVARVPTQRHNGVWRHRRADGQVIEVEVVTHELVFDGRDAVLVTAQDVTERNLLERQLMHQTLHDPLTGLPTRALLLDRIGQALATTTTHGGVVGVFYLDVDCFRLVNESLGHEEGDAMLATIGARLAARVPAGVTVASVAGEELAVCAGGLPDRAGALALARQLQGIVAEPLVSASGVEVALSACVGVTTTTDAGADPAALLRDAADALVRAKQLGPGQLAALEANAGPVVPGRLHARQRLRQAIEAGEIVLQYQPVVSLSDGSVVGAEALARWAHPERGLVAPAEFIPLAEETGLIVPLGRVVLEQACRDAARLPPATAAGRPFVVSVNVSGHQLRDGHLPGLVRRVITETGLAPERLALEMTETVLVDDSDLIGAELSALREIGVHLSLDDFGTGYSSLTRLDRCPFDIVKIDRSFVTGMHDDSRHQCIVAGVISLATALGSVVIAEGVESALEADELAHLGARLAQGYHFFAPMSLEELAALVP